MPKAVAQLIAYALSCLKWDRQRAEQRSLPMKKVNQLPAGKRVYISASGFTFFKIIEDACRGFLAHRVFSQVRQRYEDMVEEYCMASDSLMCAFSEVVNHRWGAARSYRTQYAPIPPEKQVVLRAAMQPFVKRYLASRVLRSYAMMSRSMDASRAGQQTTRGGLSRRTGDESEQTRP